MTRLQTQLSGSTTVSLVCDIYYGFGQAKSAGIVEQAKRCAK